MNDLLSALDIQSWKPVLTALMLPPIPLLLLVLLGAHLLRTGRGAGWLLVWPAVGGLWLASTTGAALLLADGSGLAPPPMPAPRLQALAVQVKQQAAAGGSKTAIVVLGGGRDRWAPEYGSANLSAESLQRLRYGLWLARATGAPVLFSGGQGWAQQPGEAEADIAARIAAAEFGLPLRWAENQSRDTRDNAARTLPMMRAAGIDHLLLVTHGWHMRRALRAFEAAAGGTVQIEPAPLGLARGGDLAIIDWLPSGQGFSRVREVLREWLGFRLGA